MLTSSESKRGRPHPNSTTRWWKTKDIMSQTATPAPRTFNRAFEEAAGDGPERHGGQTRGEGLGPGSQGRDAGLRGRGRFRPFCPVLVPSALTTRRTDSHGGGACVSHRGATRAPRRAPGRPRHQAGRGPAPALRRREPGAPARASAPPPAAHPDGASRHLRRHTAAAQCAQPLPSPGAPPLSAPAAARPVLRPGSSHSPARPGQRAPAAPPGSWAPGPPGFGPPPGRRRSG